MSRIHRLARAALLMGLALSTAAFSTAQAAPAAVVVQRYPAQSIASVLTADAALADIKVARTDIESDYRAEELGCRPAFFMTRCLDAAKEKRRAALALIRPVEIEADAFKRRERVEARDRALDEKKAKADREAVAEQNLADTHELAGETAPAASAKARDRKTAVRSPATPHPVRAPHVPKPLTPSIDAAGEARNAASYDRKALESAQRQRDIAAKKAEKEQDRARKKAAVNAAAPAPGASADAAVK